ncbi:hypothetical protein [Sulfurivermis fontis]|uniref:hypothetical protein n=1 Tax=Sulfurivermis fontis TaxID=1972068 RepID=UPI0018D5900D|nr:hypothetical protein [Sulfurivermis fontis]
MSEYRAFLRRYGWPLLSGVLLLMLVAVLVLFGLLGRVADAPSSDGRVRLLLNNTERDFVLNEMRHLLAASQTILQAALDGDMAQVATQARKMGMADVQNIPPEVRGPLLGKLPLEFKQLGFSVHEGMDAIAVDAESLADPDHTLRQLAELMNRCVACHATYTVMPPVE